jgi:hypothetical protein
VTYLYDGADDFRLVWSQLYWNDRIDRVLDLPATHVPGPLAQKHLRLVGGDGTLELVGGGTPKTTTIVAPQGFPLSRRVASRTPRGRASPCGASPRRRASAPGCRASSETATSCKEESRHSTSSTAGAGGSI